MQQKWKSLDTHSHNFDRDGDIGDGILICLQNFGLSCIQIRVTLGCGASRLTKLNWSQKSGRTPASHALTATSVGIWREFMDSLDIKDRFPCVHCRPKFYVLQENPKERVTWSGLYRKYVEFVEERKEFLSEENKKKSDDGTKYVF